MPAYPDTLELIIPPGVRVKVTDILVGEPIEHGGVEYQTVTLTAPFGGARLGMVLRVVDAADNDKRICTFLPESIEEFFCGEQFMRINGKHYLRFPTSGQRVEWPRMDEQRTDRASGGIKLPRPHFRLRLMLLIVALCAVVFAWLGVQRQRHRISLEAELSDKEYIRKSLRDDNIVPGMEACRKQRVNELEVDIAKRREALGLHSAK